MPNAVEVIRVCEESLELNTQPQQTEILVTAVISTYNSEKFIRGCLEDLVSPNFVHKWRIRNFGN